MLNKIRRYIYVSYKKINDLRVVTIAFISGQLFTSAIVLSCLFVSSVFAQGTGTTSNSDNRNILRFLSNALNYANRLDEPENVERLFNTLLATVAITRSVDGDMADEVQQQAIEILNELSSTVTMSNELMSEVDRSGIDRAINVILEKISSVRLPPDDVSIAGRRAERIIREGSILINESYFFEDLRAVHYVLVDYRDNLYACMHRHSPLNATGPETVTVTCSREGGED